MRNINPLLEWPDSKGKKWSASGKYQNDKVYQIPAGMETAYFAYQEIESMGGRWLIKIISGEAVQVFLDGLQVYIANNRSKEDKTSHVLLLDLKRGFNQLLVKVFNNFHDSIPFAINKDIRQVLYTQSLNAFKVNRNQFVPLSWELTNPPTPHQDLGFPNLRLHFE